MVAFNFTKPKSSTKHLLICCKYTWILIFGIGTLLLLVLTIRSVSPTKSRTALNSRAITPQMAVMDPGCQTYFCSILCVNTSDLALDLIKAISKTGCQTIDTFHIERQNFIDGVLQKNWANTGANFYEILITNGNLNYIAPEAFDNNDFTQTFTLNLENVPLTALEGGALLGLTKLESLTIRAPINHISRVFFQTIRATLRTLKLSKMTDAIQFNDLFGVSNMTNLEDLDLSGNRFYEPITAQGFRYLSKIRYLDLSESQINVIGKYAFDSVKNSLKFLDLSHNNLTMLTYDTLDGILLGRVTYIYLSDNNWSCDCDLVPLVEYYNKYSEVFLDVPICKAPQKFYGAVINVPAICSTFTADPAVKSTAITEVSEFIYQSTTLNGGGGGEISNVSSTRGSDGAHPTTILSSVKLTCLLGSSKQSGSASNFLDHMYLQAPSYDFTITLIGNNTVEVVVDDCHQEVTILWYSDPDIYGIYSTSSSDYGCRSRQNGSIIIQNLKVNISYTFCLVNTGETAITPFNCLPFYIEPPIADNENVWIATDEKGLAVAMVCLILIISFVVGALVSYGLIKYYPDILRGSKHVLMVKRSTDQEISTISGHSESRSVKSDSSFNYRMAPPPPYKGIFEDDSSYETPIEVERIDYMERIQKHYSEVLSLAEDAPKTPPPLPKRNSEQIYAISSKCKFVKKSI